MENHQKSNHDFSIQSSIYLRTTLDERIFAVTGGTELISVTLLPKLLPISYQTIKNKIYLRTFPLEIIRFNSKNYVRAADVAKLIENARSDGQSLQKKVGRKSNRERMESLNKGSTV